MDSLMCERMEAHGWYRNNAEYWDGKQDTRMMLAQLACDDQQAVTSGGQLRRRLSKGRRNLLALSLNFSYICYNRSSDSIANP